MTAGDDRSDALVKVASSFCVVLLLGVLAIGRDAASASNFSPITGSTACGDLNRDDLSTHTFFFQNLTPDGLDAAHWAAGRVNATTRAAAVQESADANTDVVVIDAAYTTYCGFNWYSASNTTGVRGLYKCDSTHASGRCNKSYVRLSTAYMEAAGVGTTQQRKLGTHEVGHSLGLAHRTSPGEVMQQGDVNVTDFSTHDFCHINDVCPGLRGGATISQLLSGQSLRSADGRFALFMQADGNLVLYKNGTALWASSWAGAAVYPGSRVVMQADGNLVIYSPTNVVAWHTSTGSYPGSRLLLQTDGNLVLYGPTNVALWHTHTGGS